jgi:CDP-glucose 4,6-dehydratase
MINNTIPLFSFYKGKRVFVTGHTGFKGTWLCHILLHADAEVIGYALEPVTNPSLFVQTGLNKKIHSIIGDIRDKNTIIQAVHEVRPDIIFHLAAQPLVRLSYREPVMTYETNVMGTVNILEAVRLTPSIRSFVNITTDKVYENKEWWWGYRENENLCGNDPYSNSKSCSELITFSYRNSFFNLNDNPAISTVRAGNVIGGGDYSEDRILPDCIRAVIAGKKIILRNPDAIRPYQHVLECLTGYLLLGKQQYHNKSIEGSYNFGPNPESCITTKELVKIFCSFWGQDASWTVQSDNGPYEASFLKLDPSKAKTILAWKSLWDIKDAVEKVVEFAKTINDKERFDCLERQIKNYFRESTI